MAPNVRHERAGSRAKEPSRCTAMDPTIGSEWELPEEQPPCPSEGTGA
jgi:hypothetical protein